MLVAGQLRELQSNYNLIRLPRLPCSYGWAVLKEATPFRAPPCYKNALTAKQSL